MTSHRINPNTVLEIGVKLLFDTLSVVLMTLLVGGLFSHKPLSSVTLVVLFFLAAANYGLAALAARFLRHWELSKGNFILRGSIALLVIFLSTSLGLSGQEAMYQVSALLGLALLWLRAEYYRIEDAPYKSTRDYVFALIAGITLLSYMPLFYRGPMGSLVLVWLYPAFLATGILYLGLVNVYQVFMRHHDNQLNLKRNVDRIRKTAALYGVLAVLGVQMLAYILLDLGLLKWTVTLLSNLAYLFYPLIVFFSSLFSRIADGMGPGGKGEGGQSGDAGQAEVIKKLMQNPVEAAWWVEPLINGILILAFVMVIMLAFQKLKKERMTQNTLDNTEEKTFILEEAFKPRHKLAKRHQPPKDSVRLKYYYWLVYWHKRGKRLKVEDTPQSFVKRLETETAQQESGDIQQRLADFKTLTGLYERVRYGEVPLENQDLQTFNRIDDRPKV